MNKNKCGGGGGGVTPTCLFVIFNPIKPFGQMSKGFVKNYYVSHEPILVHGIYIKPFLALF